MTEEREQPEQVSADGSTSLPATQQQQPTAGYSPLAPFFGDTQSQAVHNFAGVPREIWRLTSIATGASCLSVDEIPESGIEVKYIYCHKVEITDLKAGEVYDSIRTVMITEDGKCYACVSNGVAQDACRIFQVFGFQPFSPPIKLRIAKIKTRSGFTMFTLEPL